MNLYYKVYSPPSYQRENYNKSYATSKKEQQRANRWTSTAKYPFYSMAFPHSSSRLMIGKCWGQALSHCPHWMHSLALPLPSVAMV